MGLDTDILVLEFLKSNRGRKFVVKELDREMKKKYRSLECHYTTILRSVKKLRDKNQVKTEEYPFAVFVWFDDGK